MDVFHQLKSQLDKKIRYESHLSFLEKCERDSIIPSGFKLKWNIQMEATEEERRMCESLKTDVSLKLMGVVKAACKRKCEEIENGSVKLRNAIDPLSLKELNAWEHREKARLDARKLKKWQFLHELSSKETQGKGFTVLNIARDGNCFYRCVSQYLYGTQMRHESIRRDVCEFMEGERDRYMCLVDGPMDQHIRDQKYSDGRIASWATEAEIQVAADLYGLEIMVTLERSFDKWQRFVSGKYEGRRQEVRIYLLLENSHFYLLKKRGLHGSLDDNVGSRQVSNINSNIDWFEGHMQKINPDKSNLDNFQDNDLGVFQNQEGIKTNLESKNQAKHKKMVDRNKPRKHTGSKHRQKHRSNDKENDGALTDSYRESSVVNLSEHALTDAQRQLLERGLKFIPAKSRLDKIKLLAEISEWERRMRLREFFHEKESDEEMKNELTSKQFIRKKESNFMPNSGRDKCLDLYIELVKNDIINNLKKSNKLNISKEENEAFHELLHNDKIVIRPADKGSGIVILDKEHYIENLKHEIMTSNSYQKTGGEQIEASLKEVKKITNKMYKEGSITKDMRQYLVPKYSRPGKLKGNPKIHKANAPFRTIVSGRGTATENMAEVAEHELQEFVESSPSYVKDTSDFLRKLKEINLPLPKNAILFCFDIVKLYPSIPKKEGLEACKEALNSRGNPIIETENALTMIKTVLENNVFQFSNNTFIQKDGVAIGSKLGKNYACSYMRKWDEKLMEANKTPIFYKRFIDDGFGIWDGTSQELNDFTKYANSIHQNIKVELRQHHTKIEFLDVLVKIENGILYTDLYVKPTDKQLYLNNSSSHPPSTKKGLAYGLGIRIRRICERESDYRRERAKLKVQLRKRGYSGKAIENQLVRVDKLDRETLLNQNRTKINNKQGRVPLVLTYSNLLPNINEILRKHFAVLQQSNNLKEAFRDIPLVAYRRDKNLCDVLVHSKTNRLVKSSFGVCGLECELCKVISKEVINSEGIMIDTKIQQAGCKEKNVVYLIMCSKCNKAVYVGETERELRERMKEHLSDIKYGRDKPVNKHFGVNGHDCRHVRFAVLEKMYSAGRIERQIHETTWIWKLKTHKPLGCNTKENIPLLV